jgi:hypothetical protein
MPSRRRQTLPDADHGATGNILFLSGERLVIA